MRILFFSHYFPPEVNAPATRTFEHCVRWARAGHDVTVVTCVPNCPDGVVYEGYRNRFRPQVEFVEGVRVVRVWSFLAANAGTVKRILNYLSYMVSAILVCLKLSRPDVVISTSPQFFCGWAGIWAARLKRCPLVLEIRDIWPESIEAVGALRSRKLLKFLEWLERRMYRSADHIVAVGRGYRDNILQKADVADRISVITNGVDLKRFVPAEADPRFLYMWGLEEKFVCSYVGTIGMAHGLEVVIEAATILKEQGRNDIRFCLVGDGAARKHLEDSVQQGGLKEMVIFTGRLPKDEMPYVLASSNACLIHLKKCELFGTVIPSKVFETMAMCRPIIMGVEGEAREIVMKAQAGLAMEPGDAQSLVASLVKLADDPELAGQFGRSARRYVAEHFTRDVLADRFLDVLSEVTGVPVPALADETITAADTGSGTAPEPIPAEPEQVANP